MGDKFAEDCLKAHNEYRRKHGAQPLTLNKKISEYSQNWAQNLANRDSGRFGQWSLSHSNCFAHGYGENCAGALADYDGGRVAKIWYDEIKDFRFGYGGFAMNTGHFTQVVWKGTKEMGVGRATARSGNIYVVANYAPPGNMQGAFTANVLPPGNYNIPDHTKPKKTGLEGEVCDLVGKNAEDTVKSIAEEVYSHVTTKKPESLWALLVVRGSKSAQSQNTIKGFVNYNLGSKEDKDVIVYEFQHPPDEMEAKDTFLDEAWQNKVKLAFLEAQREKEKAADIQNKAAELFQDLKKCQRIIFKKSETVSWYLKWNVKLFHFTEVVGSWLVVVFPPPAAPKAVSPSEASS